MLAFLFPGQGSQQPGMGRAWADHPSWTLVGAATEASGRDVAALLLDADAEELRRTDNAQLATYVLSLVVADAASRLGLEPAVAAGHSLGEYSALTAAGALPLGDGIVLVAERGAAMQAAAKEREGTMAAVLGAEDHAVAEACAATGAEVWVANHNGPSQVVIAGDPSAVADAGERARKLGARRVMPLAVGGAFHTPFMAPAAERLRAALAGTSWQPARLPVVANVDAAPRGGAADWAELLHRQLTSPVRWRQSLERMISDGATLLVELGPGTVLTGMAKRAGPGTTALSVSAPDDLGAVADAATGMGTSTATSTARSPHDGEHLFAPERVVVSPAAGIFEPAGIGPGDAVEPGRVIGRVAGEDILSPFQGAVMGLLAVAGERLTRSQPVAWLRTS